MATTTFYGQCLTQSVNVTSAANDDYKMVVFILFPYLDGRRLQIGAFS